MRVGFKDLVVPLFLGVAFQGAAALFVHSEVVDGVIHQNKQSFANLKNPEQRYKDDLVLEADLRARITKGDVGLARYEKCESRFISKAPQGSQIQENGGNLSIMAPNGKTLNVSLNDCALQEMRRDLTLLEWRTKGGDLDKYKGFAVAEFGVSSAILATPMILGMGVGFFLNGLFYRREALGPLFREPKR